MQVYTSIDIYQTPWFGIVEATASEMLVLSTFVEFDSSCAQWDDVSRTRSTLALFILLSCVYALYTPASWMYIGKIGVQVGTDRQIDTISKSSNLFPTTWRPPESNAYSPRAPCCCLGRIHTTCMQVFGGWQAGKIEWRARDWKGGQEKNIGISPRGTYSRRTPRQPREIRDAGMVW